MIRSQWTTRLPYGTVRVASLVALLAALATLGACGPRANIPMVPTPVEIGADTGTVAQLARTLAPVLYLQRDETFPLSRAVAVVHPEQRLIAYHLLWQDDAHGAWIPKTKPTDQEIVWVGYDASGAPTDMWTYWHGKILHTPWTNRQVEVDVQWGKHGSLPRGPVESYLPRFKALNSFYLFTWLGLPDMWLGNFTRRGPWCFCKGFDQYRNYSRLVSLGNRIDVVVWTENPNPALAAVFGRRFSRKRSWP